MQNAVITKYDIAFVDYLILVLILKNELNC